MANTKPIKWLRDILGNKFFPVTHMKAVRDDNGNTLSCALTNINEQINTKQDTLVSGTNIKTVNGNSLLGDGNVDVTPQFRNMHFGKSGADNDIVTLITDQGYPVDYIVTSGDPQGAAEHASSVSIPTVDYLDTELNKKVTKLVSSTDNTVVRFDGVTGNIKGSGVTINDCNHIAAEKFITCGGTSSQFVKGDGSLDSKAYLDACSLPYWANTKTDPDPKYNSEPEFKLVKINGSTTNSASTENAVIQYDTATKVIKFVFN